MSLFLSRLQTLLGAWTHDPDMESGVFYRLSQLGASSHPFLKILF